MRHPEEEPTDEPLLFDLPLEPERKRAPRATRGARPPAPEPDLGALLDDTAAGAEGSGERAEAPGRRAGIASRLAAGAADLLVHAAVGVSVLVGCRSMGVQPVLSDGPALALFLLSFSFLYTVVPLAFWGHTPGMAWAGLDARSRDGEPLAFDQTARRWLGAVVTLLLAGLPLLLALGGRSLSDLLSGSETLSSHAVA
jgi:uncharacterized RDD family membrane protein YckC